MRSKWLATHAMALLMLIYGLCMMRFGELIPLHGGLGDDGVNYAKLAADLAGMLKVVDWYHTQRIVPSAIVHYSLRLLGIPPTDGNIIISFELLNLFLLVVGVYFWNAIATRLKLAMRGRWLGFVGMFGSFTVLKETFYYPVLTDTTAFVLSIMLMYFYLARRPVLITLTAFIGTFTWPTMPYVAAILLVFPMPPENEKRDGSEVRPLPFALATIPGFIFLFFVWFLTAYRLAKVLPPYVPEPWWELAPLSGLVMFLYVTQLVRYLGDQRLLLPSKLWIRDISLMGIALLAALVICKQAVLWGVLKPQHPPTISAGYKFKLTIFESIAMPGSFLVAHATYIGPIVLLAIVLWRRVARVTWSLGTGFAVLTMFAGVLALNSETRELMNFIPAFVIVVILAMEGLERPKWVDWVFVIATLIVSKAWLPINRWGEWPSLDDLPSYKLADIYVGFPRQFYFMNHGPWISRLTYEIQGGFFLILLLVFWFAYRRSVRELRPAGAQP